MSNQRVRITKGNKGSNEVAKKRAELQALKKRKAKIDRELAAVRLEINSLYGKHSDS